MLASIAAICVAPVAAAEPAALTSADFAGRWVSADKKLTLDMSRCGDSFCGVVVASGACGHTALRVGEDAKGAPYPIPLKNPELTGQLQLAANTEPYGVRAMLTHNESGALTLYISGHTGGAFSPIRRSYDYSQMLARTGDSACTPNPKTS
jgi:hypothetical protein